MLCLLLTAFVIGAASAAAAGTNPFEESKIIGGKTSHVDDARFMVQVITIESRDPKTNLSTINICGGTMVSTTHVLTAGHCIVSKDVGKLRIFVGTSDYLAQGKNGRVVKAKAFRVHPKFTVIRNKDDEYGYFDVAVIRLQEAVLPSAKTSAIAITPAGAEPKDGASIEVAGWGIYRRQDISRKLRRATFKVISRAQCKKYFGNAFNAQEFCITSGPKSAFCSGDSGGPAFIGNVQYGVVSWGSCGKGKPSASVLADLADPQINSFVRKMMRTL
ncbi:trypsin iota-like [Thrips palmi]|uniref:Trypsin iota-like n=1 Tax=Thrips palmi TaxID=161013 RepID=A0A6P8YN88_THRPL|nr:trypsin iota-like [Thrips palmi]